MQIRLWWADSDCQPSLPPAAHSLHLLQRNGNRKKRVRKCNGQQKGTLLGQGKKRKKYSSEAQGVIHHTQRQSSASLCTVTISEKINLLLLLLLLLPLLLQFQLLSYGSMCYWKIPLANLSQLSQLCHLPISCLSSLVSLVTGVGTEWEKEKVLMLYKHCSAIDINTV